MILYRMQATRGPDWVNEWVGTMVEAEALLTEAVSAGGEAHIDQVEVPTDKEGLIAALNAAHDNRMNWPGIEKARGTS